MLTSCEAAARNADFDRYLAALFVPAALRPHLWALYAFNYEVAKTAEAVSQPTLGLIRLQWWRDSIADLYAGRTREHQVVQAIAEAVRAHDLPKLLFDALIEAREKDLEEAPFADMAQLEAYADATSGHVMRLSLHVLGAGAPGLDPGLDGIAREAGIAYALTGLARAMPYHAAQRRLMLPTNALNAARVSLEDVFAGKADVSALIGAIAEEARTHLAAARAHRISRRFLPALLPAALTPLYLKRLARRGFNSFRDATDVATHRKQLAMLGAMARGRI